ncbi:MAG: hypothetical protein KME30_32045 [Iphinoe sp. HA4291-MV1]|jgi:hypothetical protein|nr:hypothetical protein [Iphinoe sp. HA4291-MV1]
MTINADVQYEILPDKRYIFYNIPDGDTTVDVMLRPLTRRDRAFMPNENEENALEKILSLMIVKWGDAEGMTMLELLHESKDEAVIILGQAFQQFFQPNIRFTKRT